jgi:hypothetical protein
MTRLKTCARCARHVFATETQCPFCGVALAVTELKPLSILHAGLSRAQRLALAAAVLGQTAIGCAESTDGGTDAGSAGMSGAGQGSAGTSGMGGDAGISGIAGMMAGQGGTGGEAGTGMAVPVYGAPVPEDAGIAGTGGTGGGMSAGTGGAAGTGMAVPVYGAPVPQDAGTDSGMNAAGTGGPIPVYGASPLPPEE